MFKKIKLKKQIKSFKNQIDILEQKRARSQAALVEALLTHKDPDDTDVDFFNQYTAKINEIRKQLQEAEKLLAQSNGK